MIQLQKSRVVRVKGKLVGPDGRPLKDAQLMLTAAGRPGSMRMIVVDDPAGRFELANVPPGSYMATTVQESTITTQPLIVPAENLPDVKLGAPAEGNLQGRVVVAGDGKVPLKDLGIMLMGDEDSPMMPATASADESGAFTLKKVELAPYELTISPLPPGAYLKSVLWKGRERLGETIDLSAGAGGDLLVALGTDGASLDAAVSRDDKPVADATVVLLPEDAGRRHPETTPSESTDETGHAAFQDVPPGNYLVFAWEKVEEGAWFDPAFVKAAGASATRVTFAPKDSQRLALKAIPASK